MRRRWQPLTALGLVVLVVVGVNVAAARSSTQADLSADSRFTLSAETRQVVASVHTPLRISAFVFEQGGVSRDAQFLLDRYHELNDDITYRIVDPDEKPAEAKRYNISGYSTVVVEYEGRRADAPEVSEIQVSSAILRVLRGDTKPVCFVSGHGEPSLDDESQKGLTKVRDLLTTNGYAPRAIDLTTGGGSVPQDCVVVLEVGPTVALTPTEQQALVDYGRRQGRLLVLGDSGLDSDADLNPVLEPWGISISNALVLDPARGVQQDPFGIIVQSFPSANPIVRNIPSIELTLATGLLTTSDEGNGLTVSNLAATSSSGYLDADQSISKTAPDIAGPIVVAAAADQSRVAGSTTIERTRVVAVANSHWLTNEFVDDLGNRRLLVNSMLWLTEAEQLLTVGAAPPQPRALPWTNEREHAVVAVAVVGVPGAVVAVGVLQWMGGRRRRRPASRKRRR
ncbi:MAG: gliding motility-associatede transport system auxiliary component [Acidimicrobiaceae bacterium]